MTARLTLLLRIAVLSTATAQIGEASPEQVARWLRTRTGDRRKAPVKIGMG